MKAVIRYRNTLSRPLGFCLSPTRYARSRPQRALRFLLTAKTLRPLRIKAFSLAAGKAASENLLTLRGLAYYASEFAAYLITLLRWHSRQTLANLKRKRHAVVERFVWFPSQETTQKNLRVLRELEGTK
jgi:hypothetical protein